MLNELNWTWYWVIVGIALLLYYTWIIAKYRTVFFKSEFGLKRNDRSRETSNGDPAPSDSSVEAEVVSDPDLEPEAQPVVAAVQAKKERAVEAETETAATKKEDPPVEKNNKEMLLDPPSAAQLVTEDSVGILTAMEENPQDVAHVREEDLDQESVNDDQLTDRQEEEPEDRRWALQQFQKELHQSLVIHKRSGSGWEALKQRLRNVLRGFPPYLFEECQQRLERLIVIALEGLKIEVPSDKQMEEVWNWI